MVNAAVYQKLIEVAKARTTVPFFELGKIADMTLDGAEEIARMGHVLDEIAEQEIGAGRPLLPVLVVHGTRNMPGAGLFKFAKKKKLQTTDDLTFFATELKRVYEYWANVDPTPTAGLC